MVARGTILRGWALAAQGQWEEGVAQMRQGLVALQAVGIELARPYALALLAEAYESMGQAAEGLRLLGEALALAHKYGACFHEAELNRLRGEWLLRQAVGATGRSHLVAEAETCFHQALDIARHQEAKSLELRAAMSLAHLWQRQSKRAEAQQLLAEIYGWFTEGFDTADLQEAKALLRELA